MKLRVPQPVRVTAETASPEAMPTVTIKGAQLLVPSNIAPLAAEAAATPFRQRLRTPVPEVFRVLVFDIETLAAGFADPAWVPQKIMAIAWSWLDEEKVHVVTCGQLGFFQDRRRAKMLKQFLTAQEQATVLGGHNILRFDLRVLTAECLRLNLPIIKPRDCWDTIKLPKSTGFKKGLDNLAVLYGLDEEKFAMDWQSWQNAYADPNWTDVQRRVVSDVIISKKVLQIHRERKTIKTVSWKP